MEIEKTNEINEGQLRPEVFRDDIQRDCLKVLSNSGFGAIIKYLSKEYNLASFDSLSDIPIATESIPEKLDHIVVLKPKVLDKYNELIEKINNHEFAKEYPFVLVGESLPDDPSIISFNDLLLCYKDDSELMDNETNYDADILTAAVRANPIVAIGHTHPLLKDDRISSCLASGMSEVECKRFGVKRAGLNLSLQDIYQAMVVQKQTSTKILECVIMYNGDFVLVDNDDNKIYKYPIIYGYKDYGYNELIEVPVPVYVDLVNQ